MGDAGQVLGISPTCYIQRRRGAIQFDRISLLDLKGRMLRAMRRRMQIIYQDPHTSLSPRMQIRQIIAQLLRLHRLVSNVEVERKVASLLADVALESYFMNRYPHEMSGGQRQRISIAGALAVEPDLIVADEPVSALDVSVQAQILSILLELQRAKGIALLFITHDLSVVERVTDRIAVMYLGRIVEEAETRRLLGSPLHPYTQALISSLPDPDPGNRRERIRLTGELPSATEPIAGCPFASRCPEVGDNCWQVDPKLERKEQGHKAACHFR